MLCITLQEMSHRENTTFSAEMKILKQDISEKLAGSNNEDQFFWLQANIKDFLTF